MPTPTTGIPTRRFRPGLRLAALALGAGLGLACAPQAPPLPERIGSLRLEEAIEGKRAAAIVDRMHRKGVTPQQSRIGLYRVGASSATLYLSAYRSAAKAGEAFSTMDALIARGHPIFGHHRRVEMGGRSVSFCLGEDQAHYYFLDRATLYWLAVDIPVALEAVDALLATLSQEDEV